LFAEKPKIEQAKKSGEGDLRTSLSCVAFNAVTEVLIDLDETIWSLTRNTNDMDPDPYAEKRPGITDEILPALSQIHRRFR